MNKTLQRWTRVGGTVRGRHIWVYTDSDGKPVYKTTVYRVEPIGQTGGYHNKEAMLRQMNDAETAA